MAHVRLKKFVQESPSIVDNQSSQRKIQLSVARYLASHSFVEESEWIRSPPDFRGPIVSGKSYDMESGTGLALWTEVTARLSAAAVRASARTLPASGVPAIELPSHLHATLGPATLAAIDPPRYGAPTLVAPRLGQGSFRAVVTDAHSYRCAISKERTLPVLQAAHIRPYADGGQHELSNGLLLRSDLHTLFDQHYLTIEPNKKTIIVSRRIREQFENGRDYYALKDRLLAKPFDAFALPSTENLAFHFECFSELERG
jgi:putative restriction endonuclease